MADPQISQITQTQTSIPDYAKPYVENLLGQAQAYTDPTQNPYQQYMGERQAQFSPLQQFSYDNAALMQGAPQLQDATAMAGSAGLGALNTGYTYNPFQTKSFTGGTQGSYDQATGKYTPGTGMAASYMSPYMGEVVARQQADAIRQSQIASQAQGAQAARAGAFGGSGDYLMRGQARGNLNRQLGDIYAQGQQAAFQQGQQQFNQEQAARLQANLANQQAGLQVGGQNLQAKLGVQQLGAGQDLQAQMANQSQLMQAQQIILQALQENQVNKLQVHMMTVLLKN